MMHGIENAAGYDGSDWRATAVAGDMKVGAIDLSRKHAARR